MKRILAGVIIALIGCVSIPSWVDAQPRDGGARRRNQGIAEQDYRGERRSWRGRQQRRRYYGGQWRWEDDVVRGAGTAVGTAVGNWLWRQWNQPREEVEESDEASLEPWSQGWMAYCKRKYKSFDMQDGRYLSYDGNRYFCNPNKGAER